MGIVLEKGLVPGECIISEGENGYSRTTVQVVAPVDTVYAPGTVLGKVTATGDYVAYDPDAADGSETVAGVLIYQASGTSDRVILNRHSQVKSDVIVWDETLTPAEIVTGTAELEALGIIAR